MNAFDAARELVAEWEAEHGTHLCKPPNSVIVASALLEYEGRIAEQDAALESKSKETSELRHRIDSIDARVRELEAERDRLIGELRLAKESGR